MKIVNAKFLISCEKFSQTQTYNQVEVAFLGRSNVGKSSIINALANHKGLAKSSSTPGKTQLINFFEVVFENKKRLIFVDLPGFGYARVSKSKKAEWNKNLTEFIKKRQEIKCFLHLVDARHDDLEIDANLKEYLEEFLGENQIYLRVFTKVDKLNQSELAKLKARNKGAIFVSNLKKSGINELCLKLEEFANECEN